MISLPDLAQKSPYEFYGRCLIKTRHLLYMYQYLEQILFLTRHLSKLADHPTHLNFYTHEPLKNLVSSKNRQEVF